MRRLADADQFSGVVLVGKGDRVLLQGTYGFENPLTRNRITTRTRFHLASQGKMFTSIAIAQLVERGKLSLDDTVGELLPGQPWTEQARAITLRQLLSHTSGLGGLFDRPNYPEGHVFRTATERLPIFAAEPLLLCARASGAATATRDSRRWAPSSRRRRGCATTTTSASTCCSPPGCATALPDAPADSLTDRAIPSPHQEDDLFGVRPRTTASRGWNAGGAGGGHASAEDMFRFARALAGGRLVSRAMVDTLTAGRVPQGGGRSTGTASAARR